jgi:hypothetical protein
MQYWCPAPLPTDKEPHRKLRSEDYQPPVTALLENYLSDSSVGADEDNDKDVGDDMTSWPEASSAAKLGCKIRETTAKQSRSNADAKVEVAKTAKLEADRKRKRKTGSSPKLQDVEKEDEAIYQLSSEENCAALRSPMKDRLGDQRGGGVNGSR